MNQFVAAAYLPLTRPKAPSTPYAILLLMSIHPIEFRYGTKEMKDIWEEDYRLRCLFRVEAALSKAEEELGMIPRAQLQRSPLPPNRRFRRGPSRLRMRSAMT